MFAMTSATRLVCFLLIATFCTLCYTENRFTPMVEPSKCMGKTVCGSDEVLNYPSEYIQQLLKQIPKHLVHLLADDEDVHREPPSNFNDLVRRKRNAPRSDDNDEEEMQVCGSTKTILSITAAKNKENQWRYIVNQQKVSESYRVEICLSAESPCTIGGTVIDNSTCRQKYIYRQLLTLNETGGIEPDDFWIPSVCSCHYTKPKLSNIL